MSTRPARGPSTGSGTERATRERFAARAVQARRSTLMRRLQVLGAVVALIALGWLVGVSPVLAVGGVEVSGVDPADRAAVEELAAAETGTPLARVGTDELARRIEAQVPGVAHADVGRGWPQTLTVDVTSRVPALAIRRDGGGVRLMDLDGVTFRTARETPKGLPAVSAEEGAEVSADGVTAARTMLRALPESRRPAVRDVRVDEADQVSFALEGTRVVWGDAADASRKAALVEVLLAKDVETIDVSAPDTPVTRG